MNNRDNLLKRNALRLDPRVKRAIQMIWDMVPKTINFQVEKSSYISLLVRVCKLVIPDFDLAAAREQAEVCACPCLCAFMYTRETVCADCWLGGVLLAEVVEQQTHCFNEAVVVLVSCMRGNVL